MDGEVYLYQLFACFVTVVVALVFERLPELPVVAKKDQRK